MSEDYFGSALKARNTVGWRKAKITGAIGHGLVTLVTGGLAVLFLLVFSFIVAFSVGMVTFIIALIWNVH